MKDFLGKYSTDDLGVVENPNGVVKELDIAVEQLKYAIREIHPDVSNECKHQNSSYNGHASWCYNCKTIWLVEDIAKKLGGL